MSRVLPQLNALASRLSKTLGVLALGGILAAQAMPAQAQSNERYAAIVIDANSGKVLFDRYADEKRFPASLTKMMTLYMTFEALEQGRASLATPMKVSAYASARPPSKLGMKVNSTISVEEAIFSLVTRSANDASVVLGEFLGGTETQFAEMMTRKARQLGMSRTTFRNANGLPNPEQSTTARDMATLGMALREHFPQYYKYFNTRSFKFRGQTIGNHNRLLGRVEGVDGIKTGYINASGFNLVTSVVRGNRKLVAVVMGGRTARSRDDHMAELVQKYLPEASTRPGGPLIAAYAPNPRGPSVALRTASASSSMPDSVPLPTRRASSINERVAAAYGSNAAGAMDAITSPSGRQLVGRDALRAAMGSPGSMPTLDTPTATALAPTPRASVPSGIRAPVPAASIPAAAPAARMASLEAARSGWIVQIAATPVRETALDMLSEAKKRGGAALSRAEAFTEAVTTGSQTLYRARFSGFGDRSEANAACEVLKARSYACYAIAAN